MMKSFSYPLMDIIDIGLILADISYNFKLEGVKVKQPTPDHMIMMFKSKKLELNKEIDKEQNVWRINLDYKEKNESYLESYMVRINEYIRGYISRAINKLATENLSETDYLKYLDEGLGYIKSDQYELAIESLLFALKVKPNDKDLLYRLGNCYMRIGEPSKALNFYSRIVRMDPFHLYAWTKIAQASDDLDLDFHSIRIYIYLLKTEIPMSTKEMELWKELGDDLYEIEDFSNTYYCYNKFIELGGNNEKISEIIQELIEKNHDELDINEHPKTLFLKNISAKYGEVLITSPSNDVFFDVTEDIIDLAQAYGGAIDVQYLVDMLQTPLTVIEMLIMDAIAEGDLEGALTDQGYLIANEKYKLEPEEIKKSKESVFQLQEVISGVSEINDKDNDYVIKEILRRITIAKKQPTSLKSLIWFLALYADKYIDIRKQIREIVPKQIDLERISLANEPELIKIIDKIDIAKIKKDLIMMLANSIRQGEFPEGSKLGRNDRFYFHPFMAKLSIDLSKDDLKNKGEPVEEISIPISSLPPTAESTISTPQNSTVSLKPPTPTNPPAPPSPPPQPLAPPPSSVSTSSLQPPPAPTRTPVRSRPAKPKRFSSQTKPKSPIAPSFSKAATYTKEKTSKPVSQISYEAVKGMDKEKLPPSLQSVPKYSDIINLLDEDKNLVVIPNETKVKQLLPYYDVDFSDRYYESAGSSEPVEEASETEKAVGITSHGAEIIDSIAHFKDTQQILSYQTRINTGIALFNLIGVENHSSREYFNSIIKKYNDILQKFIYTDESEKDQSISLRRLLFDIQKDLLIAYFLLLESFLPYLPPVQRNQINIGTSDDIKGIIEGNNIVKIKEKFIEISALIYNTFREFSEYHINKLLNEVSSNLKGNLETRIFKTGIWMKKQLKTKQFNYVMDGMVVCFVLKNELDMEKLLDDDF
jgi:tetratricopeptide (TPR) repeat protein